VAKGIAGLGADGVEVAVVNVTVSRAVSGLW
jgi:hypothetical protein